MSMQDSALTKTFSTCPTCGTKVVVRSKRDTKAQYCSRICAANMRYRTRYQGTNAGPMDRPKDMNEKTKF